MHLLPEPLYSIPTDSTFITTIAGTANGRIFMAGKDGALYELIYQVTFLFSLVFLEGTPRWKHGDGMTSGLQFFSL